MVEIQSEPSEKVWKKFVRNHWKMLVTFVVAAVLAVVMGKRITEPLKKLADIAHKVSLGDLNQRYYLKQNIDIKTGDEIDELVDAFRRMVNAFRMTEALNSEPEEPKK